MRSRLSGAWIGRAVVAAAVALVLNLALSSLGYEHDTALVALLVVTCVAAGVLTFEALEAHTQFSWIAPGPAARSDPGEDLGTASLRHLIEVHQTSWDTEDAIVWQIAGLAERRLRQVHDLSFADDPDRVRELLGPHLAELVSRDRRHRSLQDQQNPRYTLGQLGELVRRIEDL